MSSNQELIPLFKKLLKLEVEAKDMYDGFLENIKDPEIVKNITFIKDQEINHISLAKQALQILGEKVE